MKLQRFNTYEEYVRSQTETNKWKLSSTWVTDGELRRIADYIRRHIPEASFGLCHGVRNGYEVEQIRKRLGIQVMGTEISNTASEFENVIQWDFHDVKEAWIGKVDFIYSNSWDHSYQPDLMLANWMRCLKPGGFCFMQWTSNHSESGVGGADCFGLSLDELVEWVGKNYLVRDVLKLRVLQVPMPPPGKFLKNLMRKGEISLWTTVRVVAAQNRV